MLKILKKKQFKLIIFLLFISYFITGLIVFRDYGIPVDEDIQRSIGLSNYNYIKNFFNNNFYKINFPFYGIGFEYILIAAEKIFKLESIVHIYQLRHFIIFITCFIGHVIFFLLLKKIFNSEKIALLGSFMFFITPRFFAESFYNSKDIIFMHSFIISIYFANKFFEKINTTNAIMFGMLAAWSINIRLASIIIPFIFYYFIAIKFLRKDLSDKIIYYLILNLFIIFFFIFLFWPNLWTNPINGFINAILTFKNYDLHLFNYYLGEYSHAKASPWYYVPLWISITTPVYIIFLFTIGFIRIFFRAIKRLVAIHPDKKLNDLWRGDKELINLIFFSIIFLSIFAAILFKSTLYNGWRHFYFLYPLIIIIAINEIRYSYFKFKKFRKLLLIIFFLCIIYQLKTLISYHPHQYSYFNFFAGYKPHNNFEVDYWGLSNKYAIEKIINHNSFEKNNITVSNFSDTNLISNLSNLEIKNKNKLIYVDKIEKPDFLINNNYFFNPGRIKLKILDDYQVYDKLEINGVLITIIYKKK